MLGVYSIPTLAKSTAQSYIGWIPNSTSSHVIFPVAKLSKPSLAEQISEDDLAQLCTRDEAMVRRTMSAPADVKRRLTIVPNLDHISWHIRKEDFATNYHFGEIPKAKGAIAGHPGAQV